MQRLPRQDQLDMSNSSSGTNKLSMILRKKKNIEKESVKNNAKLQF